MIAAARAQPGKLSFGAGSAGYQLMAELFNDAAGLQTLHVPFKGAAELHAAVAGGHVMLGAGGASSKQIVDAGKARFLNVWTAKRQKSFSDIPTLQELGYPFVIDSPFGIAGPKGMDPKIVQKLHDAFKKAIEDPAVIETMDRFEMVPNYKNSADYAASVKEQIQLEGELLKRIGLSKDSKK